MLRPCGVAGLAIVVVTGLWNLTEVDITDTSTVVSGDAARRADAGVRQWSRSRGPRRHAQKVALAVGGAIGLLAASAAMFCGYLLTTGQ